ncbi:MAG: DUF2339 domain-containing protein [Gammaproteobacteria bacterium]|nr:DUF2339 domain-containing protein [Gammaproteobacteria bacterium]
MCGMDEIYLIVLIVVSGAFIIGTIGGLVSLFKIPKLNARLIQLEHQLSLSQAETQPRPQVSSLHPEPPTYPATTEAVQGPPEPTSPGQPVHDWTEDTSPNPYLERFTQQIKDNWMIWLGGFCVALAGIFLAIYSIEQGLLGPTGRIVLGIVIGIALHIGAEYLRRRTGESHPALAALAGAGSITLFAALLSALHLYELISVPVAFICLAIVAIATMWMAYLHGPALAAFGIVGAYLVPIMVSSGEGRVLVALTYSVIITTSALLLLRYVYKNWLWWGFIAGAIGWWAITLFDANADGARGIYLAAIGYLILAIPTFNWKLTEVNWLSKENYQIRNWLPSADIKRQTVISIILLIFAQGASIAVEADFSGALVHWSPLVVLLLFASRYQEPLGFTPWLLLVVLLIAWLVPQVNLDDGRISLQLLSTPEDHQALWYLGVSAVMISGFSLANFLACRFRAIWASLAALAPVLLLTLAYVLTTRLLISWQWGTLTLVIAMVYLGIATAGVRKKTLDSLVVWLFVGGHFALSLAAVMVLAEATLTLAFAVQLISTAWIIRHFALPSLGWLLKILAAIVVTRLTINPWVAGYVAETHWSLWTYGGSTTCCIVAMVLLRPWPHLCRWAEGAALHLFALTLWSETRYWLYDGVVFADDFTSLEAGIYMLLFGSLSVVYHLRSLVSQHLERLYKIYSYLLAVMALVSYGIILLKTLASSSWVEVGDTPLLNMMLLYYGVPVCLGAAFYWFHEARFRSASIIFAGIAAFIFVSLEIRHLWQSTIRLDLPTDSGELYTYSAVWLTMAIGAILSGAWRFGNQCYRAGMSLLALVIFKIFLVDMSDLEGLLRVASFMGLGLALLGISYLHQRIERHQRTEL